MRASQMAVKNCFIRGSVVRYVQLPAKAMDTNLLEDATRRGQHTLFSFILEIISLLTLSDDIYFYRSSHTK